MFEKVSTKEIRNIKERLEAELGDKNLAFQRREEAVALLYHVNSWLDWRDYQDRKDFKEVTQSESQ